MKARIVLSLILATLCLTSCSHDNYTVVTDNENAITYSTETAVDPANYTTYINKEVTLVLNILRTHIATGDNLIKGKYIISDEISNVESDLDMVAEAIESVEVLNPPTDYEDDREAILDKMANAANSLTSYYDVLNTGDISNLQDYLDLMESDYIALTGAFNLPWE